MSSQDKEFDETLDEPEADKKPEKILLDPEYSELISLPSVKISHNIYDDIKNRKLCVYSSPFRVETLHP